MRSVSRGATDILKDAIRVLEERGAVYGSAYEHYQDLAKLQGLYELKEPTARDVVMRCVLEKLDRMRRVDADSETFRDSVIDAINYLAIVWEVS